MKLFVFIFVLVAVLASQVNSKESSGELSTLSAKFQSFINELSENKDRTSYDPNQGLTSLMQKLQRIQANTNNRTISLEWFGAEGTPQSASLRIVLVVSSFEGMYLNSGIGTFYSALTDFLVAHNHKVTVLYTHKDNTESGRKKYDKWKANNEKRGVVVTRLGAPDIHVTSPSLTQRSYHIYQHLLLHQEEFDMVHFPDWEGPGYFSLLAKHQQLAFTSKLMVVGMHGPWRWVKHANQDPAMTQESDLETDYLEQRSVELADAVITPSKDLPQWLAEQGWNVPENIYMLPFLPGKEIAMLNQRERPKNQKVKVEELVFFGRLEERKGLKLFADALDILAQRVEPEFKMLKITFMGRSTDIDGIPAIDYIKNRGRQGKWEFNTHIISYKDRKHSLDYLMSGNRLAVMPSLVDNAPYTVYECLYTHIPFVSSDLPSISELVHPDDRSNVLFAVNSENLARILTEKVEHGASAARSTLQQGAAVKSWEAFYSSMADKQQIIKTANTETNVYTPLVSVCIPYYNRPQLLPLTLQSIREQEYPRDKIEIVLVNDGSTSIDAVEYLDTLQPEFDLNNWQIIHTENRYLGAARNTAARAARGEYILFLDDDNIANERQLATYAAVAQATSADILSAAHDVFRGSAMPVKSGDDLNVVSRSVPLGAAVAAGVYKNVFGDANFYVRKSTFLATGGFTEERGVGQEEHEWFAKAVLKGYKLEAIPETLLYYRMHNRTDQMMFNTNPVHNQVRSVRPYASILDEDDGDVETTNLLRALAHKRVEAMERDATGTCNMTLSSVTPRKVYARVPTTLYFTTNFIDCQITNLRIANVECVNITTTSSSIMCRLPGILGPANYSVTLAFQNGQIKKQDLTIEVMQLPSPNNTALLSLVLQANPSLYTVLKLINLFASFIKQSPGIFNLAQDYISSRTTGKRADTTEIHNVTFFIETPAAVSASAFAEQLLQEARANREALAAIGVTIVDFDHIKDCWAYEATCRCAPLYAGAGCSEKRSCMNDCSHNGDCVAGPFGPVCSCYVGHVGTACNFTGCLGDCNGNGKCVLQMGRNSKCDCNLGWSGDGCSISGNCPNNCNGFGSCTQGFCVCVQGRSGADCSIFNERASYQQDGTSSLDATPQDGNDVIIGLAVAVSVVGALFIIVIVLFIVLRKMRK